MPHKNYSYPIIINAGREKETERQRKKEEKGEEEHNRKDRERQGKQRDQGAEHCTSVIVSVCLIYNSPTLFIGSYPTAMKSYLTIAD